MIAFRVVGGLFMFVIAVLLESLLGVLGTLILPLLVPFVSLAMTILDNIFNLNPSGSIILESALSLAIGTEIIPLIEVLSRIMPISLASAISVIITTLTAYMLTCDLMESEKTEIVL